MKTWGRAGVERKGAKVGKIGDICNTVNNKKKIFFENSKRHNKMQCNLIDSKSRNKNLHNTFWKQLVKLELRPGTDYIIELFILLGIIMALWL